MRPRAYVRAQSFLIGLMVSAMGWAAADLAWREFWRLQR